MPVWDDIGERLSRDRGSTRPSPRDRDWAPLTPTQRRIWDLFHSDRGKQLSYQVGASFKVVGHLDIERMQQAGVCVTQRHEALRTVVVRRAGELVQVALPRGDVSYEYVDLRTPDAPSADAWLELQASRGSDPATNVLRLSTAGLSATESLLHVSLPHLVADGWSMRLVLDELSEFYERIAGSRNRSTSPAPVFHQADFAQWQQDWLGTAMDYRDFWRDYLNGLPEGLPMEADRDADPEALWYEAGVVHFTVAADLTARLREMATDQRASLLSVLLAGYVETLGRRSAAAEVVVAVPFANRSHRQFRRTVGLLANLVPVRIRLSRTESVPGAVARAQAAVSVPGQFQAFPVEALLPRDEQEHRAGVPVHTLFALHGFRHGEMRLPEATVSRADVAVRHTEFALGMTLTHSGGMISGRLTYQKALYAASTVRGLVDDYRRWLRAAGQPAT